MYTILYQLKGTRGSGTRNSDMTFNGLQIIEDGGFWFMYSRVIKISEETVVVK